MSPLRSHISWSKTGRVFRKARYSSPLSTDGRWMSAASPRMCWELDAPPTAQFSSGQRYPLVMRIGPNLSLRGCSTMWHRYARFNTCFTLEHSFSMPSLLAVSERVHSLRQKLFDSRIIPILFVNRISLYRTLSSRSTPCPSGPVAFPHHAV